VLPRLEGEQLLVDVMTPHQTHYYQPKAGGARANDKNTAGSSSPHDSGQPNPIHFLTVPPGSGFVFHVACDPARLLPVLQDGRWRERLAEAFEHAFEWLGFGAKTAVGYGAMARDEAREQRALQEAVERAARREREEKRTKMTEAQRMVDGYTERAQRRFDQLKGKKSKISDQDYDDARKLAQAAASTDWTPQERNAAVDAIEHWGPKLIALDLKELRKKLGLAALRGPA
jgi:CRISPR-associated protein Cmr6